MFDGIRSYTISPAAFSEMSREEREKFGPVIDALMCGLVGMEPAGGYIARAVKSFEEWVDGDEG